jgi:hypothetical protein
VLIERQIRDELLQAAILVLHLPEPVQLADPQVGIFLLL